MLEENSKLVERAIAAINARDLDGYLACCTEDVRLETPLNAVGGTYEGAEGIERFLADIDDAAPTFHIELERIEQAGGPRAIVSVRTSSTGRVSGISLTAATTNVYDFRDGKISRIRIFLERAQALDALEPNV